MARTAAGHRRLRHELFLYRWAVDLLEFVVPLARDGVAAEEPTLLLLRADTAQAVLHQVGPSPTSPSSRRWNSRADPPSTSPPPLRCCPATPAWFTKSR